MNYSWDFINDIGSDYIDFFFILSFLSVNVIRLEFRSIVSFYNQIPLTTITHYF